MLTSTAADNFQLKTWTNTPNPNFYIAMGDGAGGYSKRWISGEGVAGNLALVPDGGDVTVGGGSGKLNVGTVDPVFDIDGRKYATYMAGMAGVKEEVTGVKQLSFDAAKSVYKAVIDFDNLEEGSDLWLFSKVTANDMRSLTVLLTPNAPAKTWYEKNAGDNSITLYSDAATEVSFRLTAPRFDHQIWPNLHPDQTLQGLEV